MSAETTLTTYSDLALNGAIRSLSFRGQWWPERLEALLREKKRREIEDKMSEAHEQYQHHRGCPQ